MKITYKKILKGDANKYGDNSEIGCVVRGRGIRKYDREDIPDSGSALSAKQGQLN